MNIESASLFNELQSMMSEARTDAANNGISTQALKLNQVNEMSEINAVHSDFGAVLTDAINNVNGLQQNANDLRTSFDMGDHSVSIGDVMIASQKSSLAFDATVQVRNKFVDAYKEIMSMPV